MMRDKGLTRRLAPTRESVLQNDNSGAVALRGCAIFALQ